MNRVLVCGCEGAGKSTLINNLIRNAMREDIHVQASGEGSSDEVRDSASTPVLRDAEEEALTKAKTSPEVRMNYNLNNDDILPTGQGDGAMTALVTHIHLDPSAARVELVMKYRTKEEVDNVLANAQRIQTANEIAPTDETDAKLDESLIAYFACALLGLKPDECTEDDEDNENDSFDACDAIRRYDGPFTLPERFEPLFGRVRRLELHSTDSNTLMYQLRQLLLLHTIGEWSHWGVLEKVELVIPAALERPLHVCDVPGFGDEQLNPFRQSLVNEALQLECSTLCICLRVERLKNLDHKGLFTRLGKLGICVFSASVALYSLSSNLRVNRLHTNAHS